MLKQFPLSGLWQEIAARKYPEVHADLLPLIKTEKEKKDREDIKENREFESSISALKKNFEEKERQEKEKASREKADRESRAAVFTPEPEREAVGTTV